MVQKIKIDSDTCLGCGACSVLAPNTFKINNNGKAEVISDSFEDISTIKTAVESCPVGAIKIDD